MKKKLRSRKGFTLSEVLLAAGLLALFVTMAIMGTTTMFGTGDKMMAVSKAAVLGSDVMKAVTNEVRFGEEFSMSGTTIRYNSTTYGDDCEIQVEAGQLKIVQTSKSTDASGQVSSATKTFAPIGSAAYDEVRIKSIVFSIQPSTQNEARQIISCTLTITSDGTDTLWENSVSVVPLYQKTLD